MQHAQPPIMKEPIVQQREPLIDNGQPGNITNSNKQPRKVKFSLFHFSLCFFFFIFIFFFFGLVWVA